MSDFSAAGDDLSDEAGRGKLFSVLGDEYSGLGECVVV